NRATSTLAIVIAPRMEDPSAGGDVSGRWCRGVQIQGSREHFTVRIIAHESRVVNAFDTFP
ncbi:MAG: hypothetical protein R6X16_05130, partial [Anaerolineae bacterium]